jgi:hypothetical protein
MRNMDSIFWMSLELMKAMMNEANIILIGYVITISSHCCI